MDRLPDAVKSLIDDYLAALRDQLPGFVTGVFIHGSLALDAFNPHSSDVDIVAILSRRAAPSDIDRLTSLHNALIAQYPRPLLEVSYLQPSDLGKSEDVIEPHPCVHDGILQPGSHHDENSITWWILRNRGIAVLGAIPKISVDWDRLVTDTRQNMNSYWARFSRDPARMAWLASDFGVQWVVLGVLRQYYTFEAHGITSKDGAGLYALGHLPSRWHRIIQEALNIRKESYKSAYRFRLLRAYEARRFLRWIIHVSNERFS